MSTHPHYQPLDAMVYPRYSGIRTFMRLPHITALTGVDFTIVGVPFDTGGTYRVGARFGPAEIRDQSANLVYEFVSLVALQKSKATGQDGH